MAPQALDGPVGDSREDRRRPALDRQVVQPDVGACHRERRELVELSERRLCLDEDADTAPRSRTLERGLDLVRGSDHRQDDLVGAVRGRLLDLLRKQIGRVVDPAKDPGSCGCAHASEVVGRVLADLRVGAGLPMPLPDALPVDDDS